MDVSSVTDSTDWLATPLAGLAPLESSLRCQVCKEILTTPMITSCSHTFCSLCIRRYLSQEGKCPSCREPDQEMKLRHNYAVEELVGVWRAGREGIWKVVTGWVDREREREEAEVEGPRPKKRRRVGGGQEPRSALVVQKSGLEERRSTRSQSRRVGSQQSQSQASQPLRSTQEEIADSDAGSEYQDSPSRTSVKQAPITPAEPHDGLVGCPNCNRRMRETAINTHLDRCLQGMASPTPPPPPQAAARPDQNSAASPRSQVQAGTIAYTQTKPGATNKRLPTINYSLLTESGLRRKLKDLGIPTQGSKELMRKRHSEWLNLWNANCDSLQPVSKGKLLRDLDTWERNLGRDERLRQGVVGNGGGSGGAVMEKDFDREGYMVKEKDNFADLVRKARESRKAVTPTSAPAAETEGSGADTVSDSAKQILAKDGAASEGVAKADMQDVTSISGHIAESPSGSGVCQDGAPAAVAVPETLIPSTPPRPHTNGYHHVPLGEDYATLYEPSRETIDLTSSTPLGKAQPGYRPQEGYRQQEGYQQQHGQQQYHGQQEQQQQQHQPLERSSQISL